MRPLPTPVDPQRAIAEYGSWAPEEWFHIKPRERTYTESEVITREQRLVQVVVRRVKSHKWTGFYRCGCGYVLPKCYPQHVAIEAWRKHVTEDLDSLASRENVAAMIAEARNE